MTTVPFLGRYKGACITLVVVLYASLVPAASIDSRQLLIEIIADIRLNEGCDGVVPDSYVFEGLALEMGSRVPITEDEIEPIQDAQEKLKSAIGVERWCSSRYAAAMIAAHGAYLVWSAQPH